MKTVDSDTNLHLGLSEIWLIAGILLAGSAVMLGAFGAHGLKAILSPSALATFEVGVRYQMYHGLAIIALSALVSVVQVTWLNRVAALFVAGCVLFSGSVYLLSITGSKFFGPITPLGGLLMIIGWIMLLFAVVKGKEND
ncbi:DUF423 domain-containing protein [Alteromonas sp. 1_MG-2023]|uniref:DUF423 domain-containing protein n=1 Tax=Alteromonas sp. 1_MG-2023 TaxID=3062669 RepID=UPI0026E19F5F|nr:DUF423 domain-containing protein [Alteromonas sp. 1_MG-2023]MDO6567412.1 DUF423 domain-containing protein [Alteromonas sp. 1_MG-2023]